MASRDKPAAKYRKIDSFFEKSNVPVAVGASNSNNSKAADSQAVSVGSPTGVQAELEVRLQAESQAEEEENCLDVGTSNEQDNVNDTASTSDSTQDNCSIYRGFRMNITAIIRKAGGSNILTTYTKKEWRKRRQMVQCVLYHEFNAIAEQNAGNKKVPIAYSIRYDDKTKLQLVVDHLLGPSHEAVLEHKKLLALWNEQDEHHPWIRTLRTNDPQVVRTLIDLAVSVHNDNKLLTAAAWSWPSRSLANLHAERQYKVYERHDAEFSDFCPSRVQLHYRDPMHYAEMLHIKGEMERKKLFQELQQCLKFSVQIDGAVDSQQQDKKYVFVRYDSLDSPLEIKTRLLSVRESRQRGTKGLFNVILSFLSDISEDITKTKFAGITTDGESANTGRLSGL